MKDIDETLSLILLTANSALGRKFTKKEKRTFLFEIAKLAIKRLKSERKKLSNADHP